MKNIEIRVNPPYTVMIEKGVSRLCPVLLKEICSVGKVHIVTDKNVGALYLAETENALAKAGFSVSHSILTPGEDAKTEASLFGILSNLKENGFDRLDCLLALGGGTVSDVTGLAASLYMRGIRYVTLPTTLLSMVDAAVGGKCAINFGGVKNLIGAFYQPSLVLLDPDYLSSLPLDIYREGMAEVIKYAMISKEYADAFFSEENLPLWIEKAVACKGEIVSADEKDTGKRRILNFGHTFGHAIEAASDFSLSHGESVAIGMCLITKAAVRRGLCEKSVYETLTGALKKYGLPTSFSGDIDTLLPFIREDKKSKKDKISLIVPVSLGSVTVTDVPTKEIADWLTDGTV